MVKMNVVIVDSDLNSFMGEVTSIKDCCFLVSDFINNVLGVFCITISKVEIK